MVTFKSFFGKKHFDVVFEGTKYKVLVGSHSLNGYPSDEWWVGNDLFILKNDRLTKDFFDKQELSSQIIPKFPSYSFVALKNYFNPKNRFIQKDVHSNYLIQIGNYIDVNLTIKNNDLQKRNNIKLGFSLNLEDILPKGMAIPLEVHEYIKLELNPSYAILRHSVCYFNSDNDVVAIVAPTQFL